MNDRQLLDMMLNEQSRKEGFNHLAECYGESLYWYIRRLVITANEAEELLEQTLCTIFRSIKSFSGQCSLRCWLFQRATIVVRRRLESRLMPPFTYTSTKELLQRLDMERLHTCSTADIALQELTLSLSPRMRIVFLLHHYEHMSNKEIAQVVDLSEAAAQSLYFNARAKISKDNRIDLTAAPTTMPFAPPELHDIEHIIHRAIRCATSPNEGLLIKLLPAGVALVSAAIIILFTPSLWVGSEEYEQAELGKFILSLSDEELKELIYDMDLDIEFYENF